KLWFEAFRGSDRMSDDMTYHDDNLKRLERELAAVVRQYRRATEGGDQPAEEVETEAISNRIRWLLYHHLDLRVGMSSDDWVWLTAKDDDCKIEGVGNLELRGAGRFYCSFWDGHRQWTEPFAAKISHAHTSDELSGYTLWFGNRATLMNAPKVRQLVKSGEV